VIGTIFTGGKKSGIDVNNNCIKAIGTGSGRRFEINDCAGTLKMYDNYTSNTPKNGIMMKRKDDTMQTLIESQHGSDDYSVIVLNNQDALNLGLVSGGSLITEIRLEKDGKKITIKSDTQIDFQSGTINMNAENINIKASKELNLEGTQTGANLKGQSIKVEGTTDSSIKGVNVTIEATAQLELKGGAMTNLTGALVKIN
jgi:type VI secretion system secreted protein VgrG